MRILLATDSYPPLIGGATRAGRLLAQELVRRGHDVHVATVAQRGSPAHERDGEVTVSRLPGLTLRLPLVSGDPFRRVPPPFPDPELTWRMRRLVRRFRPDVVHAYGWLTYSCLAAVDASTPLLLSARDYGNFCAVRTLVRHGARCSGPAPRKCLECAGSFYGRPKGVAAVAGVLGARGALRRRLAGVHSVSRFVDGTIESHLLGGRRVVRAVIPDFREPGLDDLRPPRHPDLPEDPYIVYVGALRRVKGIDVLLEAWSSLEPRPPLVLVGTRAPDTPASLPPGVHVVLDGSPAIVMDAFDRALFAVAPSLWYEPLGNVVHEAQSRGRAVIGTTPGGHDDMIDDGVDGLLVSPGDAAGLRAAMRRLLADPAEAARMGSAGRLHAVRYTAEHVVPRFERLYRQVAAAAGERNSTNV